MHDDRNNTILDDDDALDFIIYEECKKKQDRPQKGAKGGCRGMVVLLRLLKSSFPTYLLGDQTWLRQIAMASVILNYKSK